MIGWTFFAQKLVISKLLGIGLMIAGLVTINVFPLQGIDTV
jgi:multidrug transporter EmrE-like cation transporter